MRESDVPGTGRRQHPKAGAVTKEMWLSSVPYGGRQPGGERDSPQRGRARHEVTGRQRRFLFLVVRPLPRLRLLSLTGPGPDFPLALP